MAEKFVDSTLLDKAIHFAVDAHANTERRGKGYPYIVHLMEAASIAATMTSDQEILAAAVLHDAIEDTPISEADIRREFGDRVASLVMTESDIEIPGLNEENSWHKRKQHAIDTLATASRDEKIVAISDKLSNMRAIARDYALKGNDLWNLFHVKDRKSHEWHYRGLLESFRSLSDTFAFKEFEALVNEVFPPEKK